MTQRDAQDHWVTRLLRFVCGALFGLVFGLYIAAATSGMACSPLP